MKITSIAGPESKRRLKPKNHFVVFAETADGDDVRWPDCCPRCLGPPDTTVDFINSVAYRDGLERTRRMIHVSVPYCAVCKETEKYNRARNIAIGLAVMFVSLIAALVFTGVGSAWSTYAAFGTAFPGLAALFLTVTGRKYHVQLMVMPPPKVIFTFFNVKYGRLFAQLNLPS